jgi:hypothetical protein
MQPPADVSPAVPRDAFGVSHDLGPSSRCNALVGLPYHRLR